MPVRQRVLPHHRLLVSVWEGTVTFAECLEHNRMLKADPGFEPTFNQLSDTRTATTALTADEVRAMARINPFTATSRRAVVVADQVMHAVTRMYEAQVDDAGEVGIFATIDEAMEWLGLADDREDILDFLLRESTEGPQS